MRKGKLKTRGTHTPTHGLASPSHMRTTISPGQWQPWTAVSPLLGLIKVVFVVSKYFVVCLFHTEALIVLLSLPILLQL